MNEGNQKFKFNLKLLCRILTIGLAVLILAVAAFTIYFFVNKLTEQSIEADSATEVAALRDNKADILKSAHAADSYEAFLQNYDNQITQAQTAAAQAYLYRLRASDILNKYYNQDSQNQYKEQAISDILKAYELEPTPSMASDVAICYTWVDEPDLAAQYYTLAEQEGNNEAK